MVIRPTRKSPSCWISPGVLEVGRSYYWKVRASRAVGGDKRSNDTQPVVTHHVFLGETGVYGHGRRALGPALLEPAEGLCFNCKPPIRFSW